jgi:NAD(P)-dependent dehydrogenase (short-subunit alcohol dehydrogenase family)
VLTKAMESHHRIAVVTGAFGVLGAAVARAFAAHGYRVALLDMAVDPPKYSDFSRMRTSNPSRLATSAAVIPPPPEPTTATSHV